MKNLRFAVLIYVHGSAGEQRTSERSEEFVPACEHFAGSDSLFQKAASRLQLRALLGNKPIESLKKSVLKVSLGLTFAVFFLLMEVAHAKNYYVFPIYPMLLASGAVTIERWLASRAAWTHAAVVAIIVLASLPAIPLVTWFVPPERLLVYQNAIGLKPAKAEVHHESLLPQPIADQFGWPEMVREVAAIYNSLPSDERAQTGIWAGNYGEAGAINEFGPQYGLPRAWSRHQNHWYWGPPPQVYKNLIVIQWSLDDVHDNCTSFQAFEHYQRFGMGEENTPMYLCRGVTFDIQKIWWHSHHWN